VSHGDGRQLSTEVPCLTGTWFRFGREGHLLGRQGKAGQETTDQCEVASHEFILRVVPD
jgi:hypothetical protein